MDVLLMALACAFWALAAGLAAGCARLGGPRND